jgi:LacI family transcriptional regulator
VTIDDEAAAMAMTARLVQQGKQRIGFIGGDPRQTASALRREGYHRALSEAGIASDPSLILAGDFTYRSGLAAAEALLALKPRPDAIFASNDDMAAAAVAAAHRLGLDVPGDVAICGFDDTALATTIWPELTTVRQPIAEMARTAMRLLAEAVRNPDGDHARRHERLDFTLIERGSG